MKILRNNKMKKIDVQIGIPFKSELPANISITPYSDCDLLKILAELSEEASLENFPNDEGRIVLAQLYVLKSKGLIEGKFTSEPDDAERILAVDGDAFKITEKGREYIEVSCCNTNA